MLPSSFSADLFDIARRVAQLETQRDAIDAELVALKKKHEDMLAGAFGTSIPRSRAPRARKASAGVTQRPKRGRAQRRRAATARRPTKAPPSGTSDASDSKRIKILRAFADQSGPASIGTVLAAMGLGESEKRRATLTIYELSAKRHEKLERVGPSVYAITAKGKEALAHAS